MALLGPNPALLSLSIAPSHSAEGFQLTMVWDAKASSHSHPLRRERQHREDLIVL